MRNRFLVHKSGCAVCGKPLNYSDKYKNVQCFYCEEKFDTEIICEDGHYVCDSCHRVDANNLILKECISNSGTNPILLVNDIMEHALMNIHGPEHHFLVPAVLYSCYANTINDRSDLKGALNTLRSRMVKIPGSICGSHGGCGAILGAAAFVSYITQTTSLSGKKWADIHAFSALGLSQVSKYGGPRCCKRNTYIGILHGVTWLQENLGILLDKPEDIVCDFHIRNKECIKLKCLFYKN